MATDLTSLTATLQLFIRLTGAKVPAGLILSNLSDPLSKSSKHKFTFGTGDDQVNVLFHDQRTRTASTSETLSLDGLGGPHDTVNFSKIKGICLANVSTTAAVMDVGAAVANQYVGPWKDATDIITLPAGATFMAIHPNAGWTVDGTHSDLKIEETAALALIYDLLLIGLSA